MNPSEAALFLEKQGIRNPEAAVILGTGLSDSFVGELKDTISVNYQDIPDFPSPTVQSHQGKLVYGQLNGKRVLAMLGRIHYYEGYSMQQITYPIRIMKALRVRKLFVTNAAGNLNLKWRKGDVMLITDHINCQPDNPLHGIKVELNKTYYSQSLIKRARSIAKQEKIKLREGVYVATSGPNLETRSEYKYFRKIGGDAVGMSTVPEVLVANYLEMEVCAFSVLTNDCDPKNLKPVDHTEVIDSATSAAGKLSTLLTGLISNP